MLEPGAIFGGVEEAPNTGRGDEDLKMRLNAVANGVKVTSTSDKRNTKLL